MLPLKLSVLLILVVLAIGLSVAEDATKEKQTKSDRSKFKKSLKKDCAKSYSLTCLKLDVVSWVDKLDEDEEVSVFPGISVVKDKDSTNSVNTGDEVAELAREFPNDPDARLDAYLLKKIQGYLSSHTVKLDLWNTADAVEEGRGKGGGGGGGGGKKGGGGLKYIIAAAAMMKATLAAIAMKVIAIIAKKALIAGLISLAISVAIGIKWLSHHEHHHAVHEVVAKPVYTHEEHHGGPWGHSGYDRSYEVPLPIGLRSGYKPEP